MSQNSKYVISVIGALFIVSAVYSGILIYNNRQGTPGFNPIAKIFDKKDKVKNSPYAIQEAKQNAQYNAKNVAVKTTTSAEDSQRMAILNFYSDYLNNKKSNKSQDETLVKYGTSNLKAEYKANVSDQDSLICAADGAGATLPTSAAIVSSDPEDGYVNYFVQFSDKGSAVSSGQVHVVSSGGNSLVDAVGCRRVD